jgi:predicted ATPase
MNAPRRWRFAPFELDQAEQRLLRAGQGVPLTPKAFALLVLLLQRAGQLVSKHELFATVWAGRAVTDAALARVLRELRLALGDDAARPRYVQTAHGLGLRFVAPVDAEQPAAPQAAAPALAGREAELQQLRDALQAARAGQRGVLFISAEPGMGKTALLSAALAEADDLWVGCGRCIQQYGSEEAYLPMLEALEQLAAQVGAVAMREHLLRYSPAWLVQLPWLAHDVAADALERALDGRSPARLLREFAQALEVLSRRRPVVLWLEDLHWSDRSSLDVLAFLAGRRDSARLLVLASLRPPTAQAPLAAWLRQLATQPNCRTLPLRRLDTAALADLACAGLPGSAARAGDALVALLQRRSGGNPLIARAMLFELLRAGRLSEGAEGWQPADAADPALPDSLRQLVQAQLDALPTDDQALVEAAALAGASFAAALVAAALQGEADAIGERCARLCGDGGFFQATGFVPWPDGSASAGFAFVHALYQEAVLERVPEGRRASWQRRMAQRLAEAHADDPRPVAAELALRWEAAHDLPQALACLRLAADTALARFAYPESVRLLQRAVGLLPQLPAAGRAERETELLLPLGAALIATQGYAADAVQEVYQRALELARQQSVAGKQGDLERAMRGLWNVALVRADLGQAAALAQELKARAPAGQAEAQFDAEAKLGQTCMHRGQFDAARSHLEQALQQLPAGAAAREAPRVAGYLSWVLWHIGRPDQALAAAERALALAEQGASPHSSAFALGFVAWLHAFRGEWARVRELATAQAQASEEHGLVYWAAWSALLLGLADAEDGQAERGLAVSAAALQAFAAIGAEVGLAHFHSAQAQVCLAHGRIDAARAALAMSEQLLVRNGNAYHAAETLRLRGELAQADGSGGARRWFEQALALAQRQGAQALVLRALTSLARLDGDAEALQRLREARRGFDEGAATADLRQADRVLGG